MFAIMMEVSRITGYQWLKDDRMPPEHAMWVEAMSGGRFQRGSIPVSAGRFNEVPELSRGKLTHRAELIRAKAERMIVCADLLSQLSDARATA